MRVNMHVCARANTQIYANTYVKYITYKYVYVYIHLHTCTHLGADQV